MKTPPLVIDKRRNVKVGGESSTRNTLSVELKKQSLSDIHFLMQEIFIDETDKQIHQQNDPHRVLIDNVEGKPLDQVNKKAVAFFGTEVGKQVMLLVEQSMMAAIDKATSAKTGALRDMSNWRWSYRPNGGTSRVVTKHAELEMGPGDALMFYCTLDYAGEVNALSKITTERVSRRKHDKGKVLSTTKAYFKTASDNVKRKGPLKEFYVRVSNFADPSSVYKWGSFAIVITAKKQSAKYRYK